MKKCIIIMILWVGFIFPCILIAQTLDPDSILPPKPEPYGISLCDRPGFHCIAVRRGETWKEKFSNPQQRELIRRLNRTNVPLMYRHWLLVPDDWKKVNYMSLAPFADQIPAPKEKLIVVDLRVFAFAVYNEQGYLYYWGPASGGTEWCDDLGESCLSAEGAYRIYRMQGKDCKSSTYPLATKGGAPMPYCMHYYKGFAIHSSTLTGFVHRSYGCVRLFESDAKWLNEEFAKIGTKVIVKR